MFVPFIFVAMVLCYVLLGVSFITKVGTIGLLAAFSLMVVGVYILRFNIEGINNMLTLSIGIICIGVGAYVGINTSLELLEKY